MAKITKNTLCIGDLRLESFDENMDDLIKKSIDLISDPKVNDYLCQLKNKKLMGTPSYID